MKNLIILFLLFPSVLLAQKTQTEYYHAKLKSAEGKVDEKNHRIGEWKFWDHKGNLVAIRQYKNDMLDGICLYEKYDWEPSEPQLNLLQTSQSLYEKALKRQKVSQVDTIIEKTEYKENKLHGIKSVYDANGNPVSISTYFENEKNGPTKNFNFKTGMLTDIQYFSHNLLDSLVGFDENGNIVKRVLNSPNYIRTTHYENGQLVKKEEHWFDNNGSTLITCTYENNVVIQCDSTLSTNDKKVVIHQKQKTHIVQIPVDVIDDDIHDPMDDPDYIGTPCGDYDEVGNCTRHQHHKEDIPPVQEEIFEFPEKEAQFPGGAEAMIKYLSENYKIPVTSVEPIRNKIYVGFIVEKDGSISNVEILRGISEEFDKEAKRVIRSMPKWKPAEDRGKVVRSKIIIPLQLEPR